MVTVDAYSKELTFSGMKHPNIVMHTPIRSYMYIYLIIFD